MFDNSRSFVRSAGKRPYVLGHRGARAHCPENTMVAFERALSDGADGVELDVRMSADGELFISHDDTIAITGGAVSLRQLSRAQVSALRTSSGERIPTLREILQFQAKTGAYVNVELKGDVLAPLWMARRAAELIAHHGGRGILLSSFNALQVFELARLLPEVPVALLFDKSQHIVSTFLPTRPLKAVAAHPESKMLDADLMTRLRKRVRLVNTWTVNTGEEARRVSDLGVDGIVTDDPKLILTALSSL